MPTPPEKAPLLVVSASGRALAQSAARSGLAVVVLDLFNDADTRTFAVASRNIAARSGRMDARKLLAAAQVMCPPGQCRGVVFGSGFEGRTQLLERLARGRKLFGNAPETIARVKDPARFFASLDSLGISHPETCLDPPADTAGWLVKRSGGAGGSHVKFARRRHRGKADRYFQRWMGGRTLSALFIADGIKARIVGINEQWTSAGSPRSPFRYGGAVSGIQLAAGAHAVVRKAIEGLTRMHGLVGLNGLDFILDAAGAVRVLEINPRPTATIDLHDADYAEGLFALHLRACEGMLAPLAAAQRSRAHAIVYAPEPLRVPRQVNWPRWCTDIPLPGSHIAEGAPVCSVHAGATSSAKARELALDRVRAAPALLLRKAA